MERKDRSYLQGKSVEKMSKSKKRVIRVASMTCDADDIHDEYTWHKYHMVYVILNTGKVQVEFVDGTTHTITPMTDPLGIPVLTKYRIVPIETSEIMLLYRGYDVEGDVYH